MGLIVGEADTGFSGSLRSLPDGGSRALWRFRFSLSISVSNHFIHFAL